MRMFGQMNFRGVRSSIRLPSHLLGGRSKQIDAMRTVAGRPRLKFIGLATIYRTFGWTDEDRTPFHEENQSAYADIEFRTATSEIKNPDGSVVFRLENIHVPAQFSRLLLIFSRRSISARLAFPPISRRLRKTTFLPALAFGSGRRQACEAP